MNPRTRRNTGIGLAAAALLAVGGGVGAVAIQQTRPAIEMAPMQPVPIARLTESNQPVTVRGRIAERFGNKYVVDDGSGRALVDTGREGEDQAFGTPGQVLTAQGRFERGSLHASFVIPQGGTVVALRPMGPPPHGPGDRRGPPSPPPGNGPPPPPPGAVPPPPLATGQAAPVQPAAQ